jgi:hypothetical protein
LRSRLPIGALRAVGRQKLMLSNHDPLDLEEIARLPGYSQLRCRVREIARAE